MKKLVILPMIVISLLSLTACSNDSNPTAVSPTADAAEKVKPSERETIIDVTLGINAESGEFSTLIAALTAADLVGALDGNGQFTVFAPTDAAFAAIDLDADNIGDMDVAELTNILLYHVARGNRMAEDVVASSKIRMLNRQFTAISVTDEGAFINDALIESTDTPADNGVIHVIGSVLLP